MAESKAREEKVVERAIIGREDEMYLARRLGRVAELDSTAAILMGMAVEDFGFNCQTITTWTIDSSGDSKRVFCDALQKPCPMSSWEWLCAVASQEIHSTAAGASPEHLGILLSFIGVDPAKGVPPRGEKGVPPGLAILINYMCSCVQEKKSMMMYAWEDHVRSALRQRNGQ